MWCCYAYNRCFFLTNCIMILSEYTSLIDKRQSFKDYLVVSTPQEFEEMRVKSEALEKKNLQKYLFRGINCAKYKLYSSAQRIWLGNDLGKTGLSFESFVNGLISECYRNENVLCSYFSRMGVVKNDWLMLSFLQHYGAGTPLLDFTRHFKTALFFALDGVPSSPGTDISNYVSIYYYKAVDVANDKSTSVFKLAKEQSKIFQDWDKDGRLWSIVSYSNVTKDHETVLVPSYSHQSYIRRGNKLISIYTIANLNSAAQRGEFVCNSNPTEPLESLWNNGPRKYISCIEIHRGLYNYILKNYMCVRSIEEARKRYYPNERDLACKIQQSALSF